MGDMEDSSLSSYYFKDDIYDQTVSSISEDYADNYPSVIDRFFIKYFYLDPKNPREAYTVMFHSNRVCLIGLASVHPAFAAGIKSISYMVGNTDRSVNNLKGKGKKGGIPLQKDSTLAILTTKDNQQYKIPSCIKSKLIEVNPNLLVNPELCLKEGSGYIAIVLPKIENCEEIKSNLLTQEEFEKQFDAT